MITMKKNTYLVWAILVMALFTFLPLVTFGQDTNPPPVLPPDGVVLDDPTGVLKFLTSKFPWLAGVLGWVLFLRLAAKPISNWLQGLFTKGLLFVQGTPETDDDAWVETILKSKFYRVIGFLVDWATSIKLPTSASVKAVQKVGVWLLMACLLFGSTSCAWFHPEDIKPVPVAPGHDPIIVNLERVQGSSLAIYKNTTEWELSNRAVLPASVSRAVDKIRKEFPPAWEESRRILKDYKSAIGVDTNRVTALTAALTAAQASMLRLGADAPDVLELFTTLQKLNDSVSAFRKPGVLPPIVPLTSPTP